MAVDAEKGRYMKPEGSRTWEYLVCLTCTIMSTVVGLVQGWNSPAIVALMMPDSPIPIIASDASTLIAVISVGFVISTPLSMYLIEKIGRRKVMLMSALPMIVGWGLITVATNIWILYTARLLNGVAVGLFLNPLSIYMGEIASPCLRGAGLTINILSFNAGILLGYVIVPLLSLSMSSAIFMSITVAFLIMFYFMPESPYYLAMKGNIEDTEAVLEKLRGKTDVSDELEVVLEAIKSKSSQRTGGLTELLTVRTNRRAFIINNILICSMHFGGFFTMIAFVQLIFQSVTSVFSDRTVAIVLGVVQLTSVLITAFVVDRLGRKPLIMVSGVMVATANLVIAVFFYMKDFLYMDMSSYSLVPFIATIVLMFANNCGAISLHITVQSEIFATEIKALATCLGGILGAVFHIISAKTYILMAVTWGYGPMPAFLSYFVTVVICTVVTLRLMPETKGKTFVQIQKELDN
ncbi:facilitated trehalose transporter Tret1 [Harpegnathos saltator]|uniref:Sugar transporter ERD6-like 4 n=1 Tax=Harpegnathos saltator TaxID=610380 RepID=E2C4Z7_HARSA|nr:facilitated trehalose transporter Tret1 [Harpegnathos saltator]EFN76978.1 Sugar transporter ERD6-like 4 [Harpegnathos saltator]